MNKYLVKCADCGTVKESFRSWDWKPFKGKIYRCTQCNTKHTIQQRRDKSRYKSLVEEYVWERYVASDGKAKTRTKITCPKCFLFRWVNRGNMITQKLKKKWTGECKNCIMKGLRGEGNANWKGGRFFDSKHGYMYILLRPDNPYYFMANGMKSSSGAYCYEHRYIMAQRLGRPLSKKEQIHHLNGDKMDNSIKNLLLLDPISHGKLHGKEKSYKKTKC